MSTFISKESITRLLRDVKQIIKSPLTENGIYYIHDDVDMLKGYALIIGPEDTPYFAGNYFFEICYPTDYPHSPPKVTYCTNGNSIRFNPNLYVCGKVCISLLNTWRGDQWTSCQSISTVLLTLCTLLCKDPLLNEPGISINNKEVKIYESVIDYANIDIAICDIVSKRKPIYCDFFENFYPFVKENFIKNYDKILEFAQNKYMGEFNKIQNIKTGFYSMNVSIDYEKVINKLKETKELVQIM
jgi:ubiquitin-conjugating enzyme E2 Z